MITDDALVRICAVAKLHSGHTDAPGSGLPLVDLIPASGFCDVRAELTAADLERYVREHPHLVDEWVQWCQDKRTSSGWFIGGADGRWVIARFHEQPGSLQHRIEATFPNGPSAVAEYILRELDFWVSVPD